MSETTTAVATLSPKAEMVVKPKPTKSEIIDALVEIKIEKIRKENAAKQERKNKLVEQLRVQFIRYARDNALKLNATVSYGYLGGGGSLGVDFKLCKVELPEDTQNLLKEYHSIELVSYGGSSSDARKRIRKELMDAMDRKQPRAERVQTMLDDKESRASLETILNNLTGKTIPVTNAKP